MRFRLLAEKRDMTTYENHWQAAQEIFDAETSKAKLQGFIGGLALALMVSLAL